MKKRRIKYDSKFWASIGGKMKLFLSEIKKGGQTEGGRQELCRSSDRSSRWWERIEKKSRCKSDCEGVTRKVGNKDRGRAVS